MNIIWLHVHPTIIQRHITRIPAIPWSNRSIKWITLVQTRLLLGQWRICILDFVRTIPLLLDDSFILIFGQEFFKTRPFFFFLVSGILSRNSRSTGQTDLQTGLSRPGAFLLFLPPRALNSSMNLKGPSLLELPNEISKAQTFLHQWLYFFLLLIRLDLAELTL